MAPFGASRAGLMSVAADDIPDSVVSRPNDDGARDGDEQAGMVIETQTRWTSIGARLSNNISDATRAYLKTADGSTTIDSVDVSTLSAGDAFTFDNVELAADTEFRIVADAEGSVYQQGNRPDLDSSDYPFTSPDVDIVARSFDGDRLEDTAYNINDIGNVGFD